MRGLAILKMIHNSKITGLIRGGVNLFVLNAINCEYVEFIWPVFKPKQYWVGIK